MSPRCNTALAWEGGRFLTGVKSEPCVLMPGHVVSSAARYRSFLFSTLQGEIKGCSSIYFAFDPDSPPVTVDDPLNGR
jgi:hypothetical protein